MQNPPPQPSTKSPAPETDGGSPIVRAALEFVPIAWLVLVLFAFWNLTVFSPQDRRGELPAVAAADRAVLPLLALLMLVAIIRYFSLRNSAVNQAASSAVPSEGRDTP